VLVKCDGWCYLYGLCMAHYEHQWEGVKPTTSC